MIRTFALDFDRSNGYAMPTANCRELHKLAVEFGEKELAVVPNFSEYAKVWVAACVENDVMKEVRGALGFTLRPDFTLARFLGRAEVAALYARANSYLADNGARGREALVYVSSTEGPEKRCPEYLETLKALRAKPADRWLIEVK